VLGTEGEAHVVQWINGRGIRALRGLGLWDASNISTACPHFAAECLTIGKREIMRSRLAKIIFGLMAVLVLAGMLVRGCAKTTPPKMTAPSLPAPTTTASQITEGGL